MKALIYNVKLCDQPVGPQRCHIPKLIAANNFSDPGMFESVFFDSVPVRIGACSNGCLFEPVVIEILFEPVLFESVVFESVPVRKRFCSKPWYSKARLFETISV